MQPQVLHPATAVMPNLVTTPLILRYICRDQNLAVYIFLFLLITLDLLLFAAYADTITHILAHIFL